MTKTEFFSKYGGLLVKSTDDSGEYGDHLFLHPEEIELVQEYDPNHFQIVSVHETEDNQDHVDMTIPCDYGNQPYKYGYFVIKRPKLGNIESNFMEDYINDVYNEQNDLPF